MNIKVEIVIGFLGSGKTSFINSRLQGEELQNKIIVVIQDEFGNCEIKNNSNNQNQIIVMKNDEDEEINADYIKKIISKYTPNRIFIEVNGMENSTNIINIFNEKSIKKICKIDDIISIIDVIKFSMYFRNMKSIVSTHIFNSETIILNNTNQLEKKEFSSIQKEIENINETANILEHVTIINKGKSNEEEYVEIKKHDFFVFKTLLYLSLVMFLCTFLITLTTLNIKISSVYLDRFKKFYDVFISILIQGFPFILIGSFVSSIIQICISRDTFIKIFSKNILVSCIIAAFAGLLFPICDCGTIPIVKGLMKKKIPIAAGITFMLAAPIVNPIAIIATIYAFPGMKSVVIYRIATGIIISILVGLIMQFSIKKDEEILKNDTDIVECDCGFCNDKYDYSKSKLQKIKAIFIHAGDEFFNIGKFMIIGTFLSSIFQNIALINSNMYISNDNRISLIVMILLSFLLSVCSTSDAFVAKGFLKLFSINSIMGFLVVGPMLDVKNTIMLFGSFKKKFVLKLIFIILVVSFGVLINCKLA
ncbi:MULTISPECIES: permease [unclassified Clostridium]|uniref:permease n=1 Tax=unclassified Clostridium TaxID=2614128 RepID=UPI000297B3A0|nr:MULTISPECIES: permease [unclassified Clostridium]EKQ57226.1 MAG: putative permease [Clostridium sp. Maddingley MBC34-26]